MEVWPKLDSEKFLNSNSGAREWLLEERPQLLQLEEIRIRRLEEMHRSLRNEVCDLKAQQAQIEFERTEAEALAHAQEDALQTALSRLRGTLTAVNEAEAVIHDNDPRRCIERISLEDPEPSNGKEEEQVVRDLQVSVKISEWMIRERMQILASLLGQVLDCQSAQLNAALGLQQHVEHLNDLEYQTLQQRNEHLNALVLQPTLQRVEDVDLQPAFQQTREILTALDLQASQGPNCGREGMDLCSTWSSRSKSNGGASPRAPVRSASSSRRGHTSAPVPIIHSRVLATISGTTSNKEGPVIQNVQPMLRAPKGSRNSSLLFEASLAGSLSAQKQLSPAAFAALVATEGIRVAHPNSRGRQGVPLPNVDGLCQFNKPKRTLPEATMASPEVRIRVSRSLPPSGLSTEAPRPAMTPPHSAREYVVHPGCANMVSPRARSLTPQSYLTPPQPVTPPQPLTPRCPQVSQKPVVLRGGPSQRGPFRR